MKKTLLAGSIALLLIHALAASEAHAGAKDLIGRWEVVSVETNGHLKPVPPTIEIMVVFKSGGKLAIIFTNKGKSRTKTGTYKVKGKRLSLTLDGITDKVTYRRTGPILTLFSSKKKETTKLKKRKAFAATGSLALRRRVASDITTPAAAPLFCPYSSGDESGASTSTGLLLTPAAPSHPANAELRQTATQNNTLQSSKARSVRLDNER